jgi:hypothetical protein
MPSMELLKRFRYRGTTHAAGTVLDIETRDVRLLTALKFAKPVAAVPRTPPTAAPAVLDGRTDPPKRPLRKRDTSEDA